MRHVDAQICARFAKWDNMFLSFPSHGSIPATHTVHDIDCKNTEYVSLSKIQAVVSVFGQAHGYASRRCADLYVG